jgi:hypothetical protein
MDAETITVLIKGVPHYFNNDELNTAAQKAAYFLKELDGEPLDE